MGSPEGATQATVGAAGDMAPLEQPLCTGQQQDLQFQGDLPYVSLAVPTV